MNKWIKNLKAGDIVFIDSRYGRSLRTVEKITTAGNIKVNGIWFNSSGSEKGGDVWNKCHLSEATEEELKSFRENVVIKKALKIMRDTKEIDYQKAIKIIQLLSSDKEA